MRDAPKVRSFEAMIRSFLWIWIPRLFNTGSSLLLSTTGFCKRTYTKITVKKEWIFLKNSPTPVSSHAFGSIQDGNVKWRCSIRPTLFLDPQTISEDAEHISFLAIVFNIPGEPALDLSTWINDVMWVGSKEPTLRELFLLWCCENGVSYFHCMNDINVEIIDGEGNCFKKGLND